MPFEVETKYPLIASSDVDALVARLAKQDAVLGEPVSQSDLYFDHPDPARSFAKTQEAFRIRTVGAANRLTYKGPRLDTTTKTRQELEVAFAEGCESAEQMQAMLESLGFRAVADVRKTRRKAHLARAGRSFEVVLDEVEGLGSFAEIETIADAKEDLDAARRELLALAGELGLGEPILRSYLGLLLEKSTA